MPDLEKKNEVINEDNKELDNKEGQNKEEKKEETTFTQSEVDKAISKALKTREAKLTEDFNNKLEDKIQNAIKENKRLSELSEDDKATEEMNNRIKELETRELKIKNLELKNDLIKELNTYNITPDAADIIIAGSNDTETVFNNLKQFNDILDKAVTARIEGLKKDNEFKPGSGSQKGIGLKEFKEMSVNDQMKLYRENISLYNKLSKELKKTIMN